MASFEFSDTTGFQRKVSTCVSLLSQTYLAHQTQRLYRRCSVATPSDSGKRRPMRKSRTRSTPTESAPFRRKQKTPPPTRDGVLLTGGR